MQTRCRHGRRSGGRGCRDVAGLIRPDTATAPAPRCNLQGLAVLALNICYIGTLSFTRCCTCRTKSVVPERLQTTQQQQKILLSNKMPRPSSKTNIESEGVINVDVYLTAELIQSAFSEDELLETNAPVEEIEKNEVGLLNEYEDRDRSETENAHSEKSWPEEEALSMARKVDPSLGKMSRDLPHEHLDNKIWIKTLSHGKLTVPSEDWKKTIKEFENVFLKFHGEGNSFSKQNHVIANLKSILTEKFPNVCKQAIHVYARVRTFIRLRNVEQ
ncbi:hypothetical protein J6590_090528 [Homalodisca vitripennis]|nr:hypothetical protein J6590_090528 [Homalodisca vitripennis]